MAPLANWNHWRSASSGTVRVVRHGSSAPTCIGAYNASPFWSLPISMAQDPGQDLVTAAIRNSDLPSPRLGESLDPSSLSSLFFWVSRLVAFRSRPGTANHMPTCTRKWAVSGDRQRGLRTVAAFQFQLTDTTREARPTMARRFIWFWEWDFYEK